MVEPDYAPLDDRIRHEYGDLEIHTLREMFTHQFAPLCEANATLAESWRKLDDESLATLRGAVEDQGGQDPHLPIGD